MIEGLSFTQTLRGRSDHEEDSHPCISLAYDTIPTEARALQSKPVASRLVTRER